MDTRLVIKDSKRSARLSIRGENGQTWILTNRFTGSEVGGVTYQHTSHGNHYQPSLLVDGARIEVGKPLSQLGQAAQEVEDELVKRLGSGAKRLSFSKH